MIFSSFRRSTCRRALRVATYILAVFLILDLFSTLRWHKTFNHNLVQNTVTRAEDLPSRARNQQIYIVAQFWSNAQVIVDHWADAIFDLVQTLGTENVYMSIIASGSLDNTDEAIKWLDYKLDQLQIKRTVVLDPISHQDAIDAGPTNPDGTEKQGWIHTSASNPKAKKQLRRIPYLAGLRNRGLEPLSRLHEKGTTFDKILYLNDVIFKPSDVLSLLATNGGVYDVACAIDFHDPPEYYDTFALRDSNGHATASRQFPYFRSQTSRNPMMKGLPIPVKSCWNGMVFVDATPYYEQPTALESHDLDGKRIETTAGLRFRGVPDTLATEHVEASECCLIHADLINRGQAKKGIYMNPAVRVGYTATKSTGGTAYELVHKGPTGLEFVSSREYVAGIWWNRYLRWTRPTWFETKRVWWRVVKWQKEGKVLGETRDEVGVYCAVDEMQILTWYGWKHVW